MKNMERKKTIESLAETCRKTSRAFESFFIAADNYGKILLKNNQLN